MGYRPRAIRQGLNYDLAVPLMTTNENFTRRVAATEIPLQPGALIGSSARGTATISISGLIVIGNPQDADRSGLVTGMVTSLEEEKKNMLLFFNDPDSPFDFYRFITGAELGGVNYGNDNGTIFYRQCYCTALDFPNTNRTTKALPYNMTFLVPDGTMWWS